MADRSGAYREEGEGFREFEGSVTNPLDIVTSLGAF